MPETNQIIFDKEKLKKAIQDKNYTYKSISEMMGYGATYISDRIKRGCSMRIGDYKLLCSYVGVKEDELKPDEMQMDKVPVLDLSEHENRLNKSFSNLSRLVEHKLCQMQKSIDEMKSDVEVSRSNTNTIKIQNKKLEEKMNDMKLDLNDTLTEISDSIALIAESSGSENIRKAKTFLAKMLNDGTGDENAIYLEAQKQQIAKKYVDRAKTELGVLVKPKGYGKNQTKTWFFG